MSLVWLDPLAPAVAPPPLSFQEDKAPLPTLAAKGEELLQCPAIFSFCSYSIASGASPVQLGEGRDLHHLRADGSV